jgi:hypothetical protein
MCVMSEDTEVAQILEDVRQRVHARRATDASPGGAQERLTELQAAVQDVNISAKVNAHLPLLWQDTVLSRLRAYSQRVIRRLLRWYINPIIDQQNMFNASAAKTITLLAAENSRLQRELEQLAERISALEKQRGR